jgi:two-component system sensor histidine kinase QseC
VAREVSKREPDALHPIDGADTPSEVHALLTALNKLFERLASAMRRERQFTADASHELRTPLAALKTHLQVARAQSAEPATRASLDQALEGVDRATHSVEQLLVLARADAAQTRAMVDTPVDLREIASAVVSRLSQQAVERDIDLGLDAAEAISVRGDATALQLLARNLVDNAVRYTPPGGTVTVKVTRDAQSASLEVADDGVGVPIEERPKIFNRFHRGSGEQALGADGSGLGLAIVKRIADLHGARIVLGEGLNGRGLRVRLEFALN